MSDLSSDRHIRLAQYAFVAAGIADGLTLSVLLEFISIDPAAWPALERRVEDCLLDDLNAGLRLHLQLERLQIMARSVWARPIPPLDDDFRAWLDFQRQLPSQAGDPHYLERLGLRPGDIGWLQRQWGERMAADPKLMDQAADIMAAPARSVAVPRPPAPELPKPPDDGSGTGFFSALTSRDLGALPFDGDKEGMRLAPPLSVELPAPPTDDDLDGTKAVGLLVLDLGLPFAKLATTVETDERAPRAAPQPNAIVQQPLAMPAPHVAPPQQAKPGDIDVTAYGLPTLERDALPFVAGEAPAPPALGVQDQSGETGFVSVVMLGTRHLPFGDDDLDGTAPALQVVSAEPLPFSSSRPNAPPSVDNTVHDQIGETGFVDLSHVDFGPATPFAADARTDSELPLAHRPLAGAGSLTLAQYAAVETELALDPSYADAVLARYGLDHDGRRAHARALRTLFDRDSTAHEVWTEAQAAYAAWRSGQRPGGRD